MDTIIEQAPIVFHSLNIGFVQTMKLFAVTLLGSLPLGLLICFGEMNNWAPLAGLARGAKNKGHEKFARFCSRFKPIAFIVQLIVWVFRGTPLMLQLLIIYFFPGLVWGNPIWGGGEQGRFLASAVAFIINYACYFAEIYRGGIQAVPRGQQEAGQVLGMTKSQIFFKVTLIQMVKHIVPPMGNEFITLIKDTSLARIIALQEVIWAGQAFLKGSQGISGAIWPMFFTGFYYLAFTGLLTLLLNAFEKKMDYIKA